MPTLRALLAAAVDAVTLNPIAGRVAVTAEAESGAGPPVRVRAAGHQLVVDVATTLGGGDEAPDPLTLAVAALAAGQVISLQWWAARMDVRIDAVTTHVTGHADLRTLLDAEGDGRPGPSGVDVAVVLSGPDDDERYAALVRTADAHSPLLDLFTHGTPTTTTLTIDRRRPT